MRALLVMTALALCTGAQSQHPPQAPEVKAQQESNRPKENQNTSEQPPQKPQASTAANPNPHPEPNADHTDDEGSEYLPAFLGIRLKITDSLLVLFTLVLAIANIGLWSRTKELADDARRTGNRQAGEMQTSLAIARQSADAATRTVQTMADTARHELRAYVWERLLPPTPIGTALRTEIRIRNSGRTPACDVCCWAQSIALTDQEATTYEFPSVPHGGQFFVNPGSLHTISVNLREVADEDTRAITAGIASERLYVWGKILYMDVFRIRQHWKAFRLYWRVEGNSGAWAYCKEGNEIDPETDTGLSPEACPTSTQSSRG